MAECIVVEATSESADVTLWSPADPLKRTRSGATSIHNRRSGRQFLNANGTNGDSVVVTGFYAILTTTTSCRQESRIHSRRLECLHVAVTWFNVILLPVHRTCTDNNKLRTRCLKFNESESVKKLDRIAVVCNSALVCLKFVLVLTKLDVLF